jgi:hypothetical protein
MEVDGSAVLVRGGHCGRPDMNRMTRSYVRKPYLSRSESMADALT